MKKGVFAVLFISLLILTLLPLGLAAVGIGGACDGTTKICGVGLVCENGVCTPRTAADTTNPTTTTATPITATSIYKFFSDNALIKILIGEVTQEGAMLSKFLLALLMFILIFAIAGEIPIFQPHRYLAIAFSAILTVLGIRLIPDDWATFLFLPTSAFILAISLGIQFVAIGFINYRTLINYPIIRKFVWILWAVILAGFLLWYSGIINWVALNFLGLAFPTSVQEMPLGVKYIYGAAIIIALLMLKYDKKASLKLLDLELKAGTEQYGHWSITKLDLEIRETQSLMNKTETEDERKMLANRLKHLIVARNELMLLASRA